MLQGTAADQNDQEPGAWVVTTKRRTQGRRRGKSEEGGLTSHSLASRGWGFGTQGVPAVWRVQSLGGWSPSVFTGPVSPGPQSRPCGSGNIPGACSWPPAFLARHAPGSSLRRVFLSSLCFGLIAPKRGCHCGSLESASSSPRSQASCLWSSHQVGKADWYPSP